METRKINNWIKNSTTQKSMVSYSSLYPEQSSYFVLNVAARGKHVKNSFEEMTYSLAEKNHKLVYTYYNETSEKDGCGGRTSPHSKTALILYIPVNDIDTNIMNALKDMDEDIYELYQEGNTALMRVEVDEKSGIATIGYEDNLNFANDSLKIFPPTVLKEKKNVFFDFIKLLNQIVDLKVNYLNYSSLGHHTTSSDTILTEICNKLGIKPNQSLGQSIWQQAPSLETKTDDVQAELTVKTASP